MWGETSWGEMSCGEKCHMGRNVAGRNVMGRNVAGRIVFWGEMLQSQSDTICVSLKNVDENVHFDLRLLIDSIFPVWQLYFISYCHMVYYTKFCVAIFIATKNSSI